MAFFTVLDRNEDARAVALSGDAIGSLHGESSKATGIDDLLDRLERDEFDLVAVGRALLVDPAWARKVQEARYDELLPFKPAALATLSRLPGPLSPGESVVHGSRQ